MKLGLIEIVAILAIVLLVLGPKQIPKLIKTMKDAKKEIGKKDEVIVDAEVVKEKVVEKAEAKNEKSSENAEGAESGASE